MDSFVRNKFDLSKCTVCRNITEEIFQHQLLKVIICRQCHLSSANSVNGDSAELCLWCRTTGELLPCVQCPQHCCYDCINANLGTDYINCLNEKNWICFVCDSGPLEKLQYDLTRSQGSPGNIAEALAPETAISSTDISSPYVTLDDIDDQARRVHRKNSTPSQDLDYILNMYDKQIQSSLELADANMPAIISEINSLETEQLGVAIHSFKKCLSAFASDLSNLEARVSQATASGNLATLTKLTALLRILAQHHIFNRLCHPRARIRDDKSTTSRQKRDDESDGDDGAGAGAGMANLSHISPPISSAESSVPSASRDDKMVLIIDQKWLKDPKQLRMTVEKVAIDLSQHSSKKRRSGELSLAGLSSAISSLVKQAGKSHPSNKQHFSNRFDKIRHGNVFQNLPLSRSSPKRTNSLHDGDESSESAETKIKRQRRSLVMPSWLSDFKLEKENAVKRSELGDHVDEDAEEVTGNSDFGGVEEDERDHEWTDYRFKNLSGVLRKRGRPRKYPLLPAELLGSVEIDPDAPKRGRGRPRKMLNDKQPRFYIQKLNGDALHTIGDSP